MNTITDKDYVIYADQVADLLKKALLGLVTFNPMEGRIEIVEDIYIMNKKKNVGSFLNKKWEVYPTVTGIKLRCIVGDEFVSKVCPFENSSGKYWIEEVLPKRAELYREIERQLKMMR